MLPSFSPPPVNFYTKGLSAAAAADGFSFTRRLRPRESSRHHFFLPSFCTKTAGKRVKSSPLCGGKHKKAPLGGGGELSSICETEGIRTSTTYDAVDRATRHSYFLRHGKAVPPLRYYIPSGSLCEPPPLDLQGKALVRRCSAGCRGSGPGTAAPGLL